MPLDNTETVIAWPQQPAIQKTWDAEEDENKINKKSKRQVTHTLHARVFPVMTTDRYRQSILVFHQQFCFKSQPEKKEGISAVVEVVARRSVAVAFGAGLCECRLVSALCVMHAPRTIVSRRRRARAPRMSVPPVSTALLLRDMRYEAGWRLGFEIP